ENHPETVAALRRLAVPVVLVDRDVPSGVDAARAAFDHAAGMRAATRHLLELGHRRFAFITGGPERPARERRRAVEEELAEAGDGAGPAGPREVVLPTEFVARASCAPVPAG